MAWRNGVAPAVEGAGQPTLDDRFGAPDVAERTIGMATNEASDLGVRVTVATLALC